MPCTAGELCRLPRTACKPPNGHACRGLCGGRLHGICGELEDPDRGNEIHRICHSCVAKKVEEATLGRSSAAKRKHQEGGFLQQDESTAKKSSASKPRTRLSFGQKLEVLKLLDQKVAQAEIARRFNCGLTAIGTIKKERESLEGDAAAGSRRDSSKSSRKGDHPEVDKHVMGLVEQARTAGLPVTRATIMSFGITVKKQLLAAQDTPAGDEKKLGTFGAGDKWAKNFIARSKTVSAMLHGEVVEKRLEEIREECKKYTVANIFNVGETGLFYRLLPNRTYLSKGEKRSTARGTKGMKAKDRVSAYMCTNATGTAKVPMAVIGNSQKPRCFRLRPSPIQYFPQEDAWPDGATFKKWWLEVFVPFVRRWTHLPVLCLMNDCTSHDLLVDPGGQITTMVYPPTRRRKHQPMDMGIIAATKCHYRRRFISVRVSTLSVAGTLRAQAEGRGVDKGMMGLAQGHPAHVLDAVELLEAAWDDITAATIARCWIKALTLPVEYQADLVRDSGKGAINGSKDAGVAELTAALNALSVAAAQTATAGPGVQDEELCNVLAHLDIVPGRPAHPAAIKSTKDWAGFEEQEGIAEVLLQDKHDVLMERVTNVYVEETSPSDDELELEDIEGVQSAGGEGSMAPPPYSELSSFFGPLEMYAESCGMTEAAYFLSRARMLFLAAHAAKSTRQAHNRGTFTGS